MTTDAAPSPVDALRTPSLHPSMRPRYEGSNICTWIGFKHVNYIVEEAVLAHFRDAGLAARQLYEILGLGLDLVSIDTRIPHALHMDDEVDVEVSPDDTVESGALALDVVLRNGSAGAARTMATSRVSVCLRPDGFLGGEEEVQPGALAPYVVRRLGDHRRTRRPGPAVTPGYGPPLANGRGTTGRDPVLAQLTDGRNAFGWKWRIPYSYCHFTERLQMSGYLRQMEEVVDLFLASRGISIRALLQDRHWIPVVPHSRIEIVDEALMEEDLYTVYSVEDIYKDVTYTARMDCYVVRDGQLVTTATGTITHGYAHIDNRCDWRLVSFDEPVLRALRGDT